MAVDIATVGDISAPFLDLERDAGVATGTKERLGQFGFHVATSPRMLVWHTVNHLNQFDELLSEEPTAAKGT